MMRPDDLLRLSTRMFKTRPMRTWLTILGVGVGIAAIFFLVTLGYGLQKLLLDQITTSDSILSLDVYPPESGVLVLDPSAIDRFSATPNVVEVAPVANVPTHVTVNNYTGSALATVVKPSFFKMSGLKAEAGELLTAETNGQVVITSTVLKLLNLKNSEALGQNIAIDFFATATNGEVNDSSPTVASVAEIKKNFKIIGVVPNDLSSIVYVNYSDLPELQFSQFAQAKVKVTSLDNLDQVRNDIKGLGFTVFALSDTIEEANKIFKAIQFILALFGIVALLVAAIGMFNTVTIALLERTQEIGIMKSIGAAKTDIMIIFLTESALMGFFGGVSGVLMGYGGGVLFNFGLNLIASHMAAKQLDLFVRPWWFIAMIIIFSTAVGFLTGILPSRRASRLNTLEALRYK